MFNKDSALVKIWIDAIKKGTATVEQIPSLSNLKEVILSLMEE